MSSLGESYDSWDEYVEDSELLRAAEEWESSPDSLELSPSVFTQQETSTAPASYTNHSGGANGSDIYWQKMSDRYNVKTVVYSFPGHATNNPYRKVLNKKELKDSNMHLSKANKVLHRKFPTGKNFVDSLLQRNWYQVKNSDAVFAVGKIIRNKMVDGGTGWAVQMAVDNNKSVYVFDCFKNERTGMEEGSCQWFKYDFVRRMFKFYPGVPELTHDFAGIGTRALTDKGKFAIEEVFERTFNCK
ncbi:uncharacterized protein LOC106159476 [Lingula anatina]|uniref:Uncharacterized protein LOC106159476 n=1 Tax=Lingula anatina TaxID=7574 RepID=A0A1S3HYZ0_LINAN|nr:uncharacterized protein LOC106159476 [Lingula anatina]|eukprot:XP_013391223.1 uncharacterized protein LOC106159476 [Lingula anatina]